ALSPVAAHIVELIGLDAAIVLFERYGGVRVYIPETVTAEHALTHLLGLPAARGLAAYYGREYVDIPKGLAALLAARNARIIAEHQGGRTVRDLALSYDLTERRIYYILATSRNISSAQRSLF